jgi:hypothetical protein
MTLSPAHNYLLAVRRETLEGELREIQNRGGMGEHGGGSGDLQTKVMRVHESKQKLRRQFSTCHSCQLITKKCESKVCEKCQC